MFLTAGHVVQGHGENGRNVLVGMPEPGACESMAVMQTVEVEQLPHDLGLLRVAMNAHPTGPEIVFPWRVGGMRELDDIQVHGYAYGTQQLCGASHAYLRSFKGYVVSCPSAYELLGVSGNPFSALELSFSAPRGLSGAPVLHSTPNGVAAVGVVIGNASLRMGVGESVYVEESSERSVTVREIEVLPQVRSSTPTLVGSGSAPTGAGRRAHSLFRDLFGHLFQGSSG